MTDLTYTPGDLQGIPVSTNDFYHDTDSGSYSGPELVNTYAMPYMDAGEAFEFSITLTLSSEPTSNIIVLELMNDAEDTYIEKGVIGDYGGFQTRISAVVTKDMINSDPTAFGAPSLRVNVIGSDGGNYFVDIQGIRIRNPSNQGSGPDPGGATDAPTTETFD